MVAIEISEVTKSFGKTEILHGISFEITPGQIVGLVGPSGCGKTTLVDLIVGNTIPTSGTVALNGEYAPYPKTRATLGYMPQEVALYEDVTAADNLEFFGALYGLSRKQIKEASKDALALAQLTDQHTKLVADFSGGMKRRLSLAVALLHDPSILVLDEPTVGLDPVHRIKLWDGFRMMAKRGACVLITTHSMEEAAHCDKVALIREGNLIRFNSPQAIIEEAEVELLEDAFIKLVEYSAEGENHA